jgi:putative DNA primase/helicase
MDKNRGLIEFLQRAVGYSLTGSVREQCFFLLWGSGANGKSTFLDCLRTMLGNYGHRTRPETFLAKRTDEHSEPVAALRGARMVTTSETAEGRRLAEGLVKDLCGGETLRARALYQNSFEFRPECKLWIGTNHKPTIRGTDHAIWRRVKLIPFTVMITEDEQDKDLQEKLRREWPGILAWAVRGCLAWQSEGLPQVEDVVDATKGYRDEMDVLGEFIAERCVLGENHRASSTELFKAYVGWSGDTKSSAQRFNGWMQQRGFKIGARSTGGYRFWDGIGIVHENDDPK